MTITGSDRETGGPAARPRPHSHVRDRTFVGGQWREPAGDSWLPVHDCSTEVEIGTVRSSTAADVDLAVRAAQDAFAGWRAATPEARGEALLRLHRELTGRADELAAVIAAEVGTALGMSKAIQVTSALDQLASLANLASTEPTTEEIANTLVVHEPVGVVGAITPWNYPLFQTVVKVAAALAAGCPVVHKPSELAPLSTFILAEAVAAAGLPDGVYNVVTGAGPTVGEALVSHPGVRMVSFTGSTTAGTRVYSLAAQSVKRVALELGGKSASVLLDDADLPRAVKTSVNRAFLNSGQTCDAWSRLLVPRHRLADVLELAAAAARRLTLGDPFAPDTRLGPLVSARQRARVCGYISGAERAGARVVTGGADRPAGFDRGHYVEPTVLGDVTAGMAVAREEVFGPVLAVLAYDSEAEAVGLANATAYGLSGAVWSADPARALAFARRMDAGQIVINGGRFNPLAPFGGTKQSGIGREMGKYGMAEFREPTAYQR
ncbi:MAG: aldehyde dehydrogenase family protein [Micromonosporaceae bacterium]|nr:aldehyde dehydrogenase family protein [Micromonosporaceae bacterium]